MSTESYIPKVNDYVKWGKVEGWIYWIDEQESYLTIETSVRPKHVDDIQHSPLHRYYHCCICCYHPDWSKLVYVKSRKSVHDNDEVQG